MSRVERRGLADARNGTRAMARKSMACDAGGGRVPEAEATSGVRLRGSTRMHTYEPIRALLDAGDAGHFLQDVDAEPPRTTRPHP